MLVSLLCYHRLIYQRDVAIKGTLRDVTHYLATVRYIPSSAVMGKIREHQYVSRNAS